MIRLNHKTMKFRMIHEFKTVARVDEVETGHTADGRVHRGYSYTQDGRRILEATIPADPLTRARSVVL